MTKMSSFFAAMKTYHGRLVRCSREKKRHWSQCRAIVVRPYTAHINQKQPVGLAAVNCTVIDNFCRSRG
jgi:outer membrane lipoprotein-sorting protein